MASVVNLNRFRKEKKRAAAEQRAAENRTTFGRTKKERKTTERDRLLSDGVNDMSCRQFVPTGQPRLARRAATERAALGEQFGTGGAMDRAIDSTAAQQRGIGGIDDGIDRQPRYIAKLDADPAAQCVVDCHRPSHREQWAAATPSARSAADRA